LDLFLSPSHPWRALYSREKVGDQLSQTRSNEAFSEQLQKREITRRETENIFFKSGGSDMSSTLDEHEPPQLVRQLQKELSEVKTNYTEIENAFIQYRKDTHQEQEFYDELSKDMDELKEKHSQIKNDRDSYKKKLDVFSKLYIQHYFISYNFNRGAIRNIYIRRCF